ncbi:MAG: alkane 1-monooxygenase [Spirochaetes bacterium]|nr:alkane 1-monooxygenase [Spirochaetota bacterium]
MTSKKKWAFLLVIQMPVQIVVGYLIGFNYFSLLLVFVAIPIADQIFGHDTSNPTPAQIGALSRDAFFLIMPVLWVPCQIALLVWGACEIQRDVLPLWQKIGLGLSLAVMSGSGIIIAHEFGHRNNAWERTLAKILLASVSYMHFIIEHNLGHHTRVATSEDPSSARQGENFYAFWLRSVGGSYRSAWRLELARLRHKGYSAWGWRNQMLWFTLIPFAIAAACYFFIGLYALIFFIAQSFFAFSMLELINYIEHYGLERKKTANGEYEPVSVRHSWNANQLLSNLYMIHLERHSDHHHNPTLRYQLLSHREESPQLPGGYGAMFPLALVPPLWFRIIDPLVEKYRKA